MIKLKNVINYRNLGLALYILVLIPILNIGIQSSLLPTLSIPDFITAEVAKYPGSGILFGLLIFILLYLFAKLFLSLPIMIFGDKSFKDASRLSFATIRGDGLHVALLIGFGLLLWITLTYLPFMLFKNAEFILLRILRILFNISMTVFTLLVSPFILAISLETYNSYVEFGDLAVEETAGKIKLGFVGQKLWKLSERVLGVFQSFFKKVKNPIILFIGLTLAVIIVFNIYSEESINTLYQEQLLIGHRGGDYGVENTIESVVFAGLNGADYVEIDVLLSRDNVPIVIHDNNLKRLAGTSQKISNLTAKEIKEITIRSGGKESKIPTLEELTREVKGRIKLLVEFKTHGQEKESIVDKTIEVLEKEGVLGDTIFHTSSIKIIEEFSQKHDNLPLGYVFIGKIGDFTSGKMSKLPVDFVSAEESLINKKMIKAIHKSGKAVFAWTINDEYKAERLLELGVDGLITDYPVEMVEIRDRYRNHIHGLFDKSFWE